VLARAAPRGLGGAEIGIALVDRDPQRVEVLEAFALVQPPGRGRGDRERREQQRG